MKFLTLNEEVLLLAILKLKDNAYPVTIREEVIKMTQKKIVYGALYNSLDNLLKKDLVVSRKGDPTPEKGGKSKIYFSLTQQGMMALQKNKEFHQFIWEGMEELVLEKGDR
jgi:DNA-binding PadR family transcriptional regulator